MLKIAYVNVICVVVYLVWLYQILLLLNMIYF